MNIKMKVTNFLWVAFYLVHPLTAQQGFVTSGGDSNTPDGSIAYSIGQVAFVSIAGEAGYIHQGIQQPYQFNTVSTNDIHWDSIFRLYPIPANQNIFIQLSADESMIREMDLTARVYDMEGKLVLTQKLKNNINNIWLGSLPPSMYFLQLSQATTFLRSASFTKIN